MTLRMILLVGVSALMFGSGFANAQTVGDWVLANYRGGDYWFPGVVSEVNGDRIVVKYDDGDIETLSSSEIRPYNWVIGYSVECNWQGGGDWYAGKITSLGGERLVIAYDDGDTEITTTGMCRSQ